MKARVFDFQWQVNDPAGYCWAEVGGEIDPDPRMLQEHEKDPRFGGLKQIIGKRISLERAAHLSENEQGHKLFLFEAPPGNANDHPRGQRTIQPLATFTGLFRDFANADKPVTPESIKAFADRFGFLNDRALKKRESERFADQFWVPEIYKEDMPVHGEWFQDWKDQILSMRGLLEWWDLARSSNTKGLSRFIESDHNSVLYWGETGFLRDVYLNNSTWGDIWWPAERWKDFFDSGDLVGPAMFVINRLVNKRLKGRVSPQLLFEKNDLKHTLSIVPKSLVDAIWLQFARALDGNREYRACRQCRTWFEVGPGAASRARIHCSDRCKVAFNRRKDERTAAATSAK